MRQSPRAVTFLLAVTGLIATLSLPSFAEIPRVISYQGKVTDSGGTPVADGNYGMRFRIYTAQTGGSLLWDSNTQSVALTDGIFNVMLGESPQPALTLTFDQDYWLLVRFGSDDQTPRKRLGSVGYAYMASGLVPGTEVAASAASGLSFAIKGKNYATTGATFGVRGECASTEEGAAGVYGYAGTVTGWPTYGVLGRSVATGGYGVAGVASSTYGQNHGVHGESASTQGTGVYGWTYTTSGTTYGVYGRSSSTDGTGVYGLASAATGSTTGGFFESSSSNGTGVQGEGDFRGGRFRDMDSNNYCYAGYSTYKTYGTGTNAFVQNHPRDNDRVIVYAAAEGDEVATYTRGTARLVDGEVRVPLGETFKWVTNPDIGLTAHLTPRGKATVLFVESLSTEQMVVRAMDGFPDDVMFDYIVYGVRIGFEEVSIVQDKQEESSIPSMADHHQVYTRHPELRKHNSLERFKQMRIAMGITEPLDLSASQILRESIGEFDGSINEPEDKNPGSAPMPNIEEESRLMEERRLRD